MHSLSNLLKFHSKTNEKLNYESMSLDELIKHQKKYQSLNDNSKLINSLKDKGEKIKLNLKIVQELIEKRSVKTDNIEIDNLLGKLETLKVEQTKKEDPIEEIQPKENYFSKITSKPNVKKDKKQIDEKKLDEVKQKILLNMEKSCLYKSSKEIPVDDAFKLLKEHEKRIQEYQMKQAAERLLMGQSVKYEFTFLEKTDKTNLTYRNPDKEPEFDDDEFYDEDDDDYYDEDDEYGGSRIDRVHKTERLKYKQYSDDLEKVD